MAVMHGDTWFLRRGECPDCRADIETKEFGVEDELSEMVTAVTIGYCNSCDESKTIEVSQFRA